MDALVTKPYLQLRYPKIAFMPETQVSIFLHSVGFQSAPKTLPNNILGPMEMKGCFGYEIILATSVPRKSEFTLETHVLHLFTFSRFMKCSKTTPINI
jgi:hypothetical protein